MEHIIVTDLGDGFVRLAPEKGYALYSITLDRTVSSAVVRAEKMDKFKAIAE